MQHSNLSSPADQISRQRLYVGMALLTIWLASMAIAFWWFQYRNVQTFTPQAVFFDSQTLQAQLQQLLLHVTHRHNQPAATVVHFYNPGCPCNKFNERHVRDLIAQYGRQGVRFIVMVSADLATDQEQALQQARQVFNDPAVIDVQLAKEIRPPSSPAVAILDAQDQLAYFGPYSIGATCSVQNGAYVETTLDKLFHGIPTRQLNTLAVGCFCDWPATHQRV